MTESTDAVVGIFVKVPEAGRVKTRLGEDVGMERAASFYAGCVAWLIERIRNANFRPVVFFAPPSDREKLKKMYEGIGSLPLVEQKGSNLGQRMYNALTHLNNHYNAPPLLIGSDTPLLPLEYLRQAANDLDDNDLVLGPAADGGYYLIGTRTPDRDLFFDMKWSHSGVLEETLDRAREQSLAVRTLPEYNDIDTLEDLLSLVDNG